MLERLIHEPLAREIGQPLLTLSSLNINCFWVQEVQDWMMISVAWLELPLCSNVHLRVCRLLAPAGSSRGEVHRCETVSGGFWSMVESEGCP